MNLHLKQKLNTINKKLALKKQISIQIFTN